VSKCSKVYLRMTWSTSGNPWSMSGSHLSVNRSTSIPRFQHDAIDKRACAAVNFSTRYSFSPSTIVQCETPPPLDTGERILGVS
jgi:hypothetical protein